MKKKILAAGLASTAIAALPVVGVFAADPTIVDTVEVTVTASCTLEATGSGQSATNLYQKEMTNGQLVNDQSTSPFPTTQMSIFCNKSGGWSLTAVGTGADDTDKTAMNAGGSGADIPTSTQTGEGKGSSWAFKVTGTGSVSGYNSYSTIPSSATPVAAGTVASGTTTISADYQVWIGATQQADTYTGQVTYTLVNPAV